MEELARRAAEAMAALGRSTLGTWEGRRDALLQAGKECDSGFDEVLCWFEYEVEE